MKFLNLVFAVVLCAAAAFAQSGKPEVQAFGGLLPDERGNTRVLYWHSVKNVPLGQFAIDYGRPLWKKAYDLGFDATTKGKTWRFGNNFWTTLDTALPLKINGKDVAPGFYYLGLSRSADGATWNLVFIDPAKARQAGLDAFMIDKAPVEFSVPIKFEKVTDSIEKLTVVLLASKDNIKDVTLKINWGTLQLTAPIQVIM
ncbi:MAG: DUF2911 domain-containing protein [Acidobacteriota bacterium]